MHAQSSRQVLRVSIPLVFITIILLMVTTFPDSSQGRRSKAQPEAVEFEVTASELSAEGVLQGTAAGYVPKANQFSSPSLNIMPLSYIKYAGELQFSGDGSLAPNSLGKFTLDGDKGKEEHGTGKSSVLISYRDKESDKPNEFFGIENSEPGFIFLLGDDSGSVSVYGAVSLKKYQETSPPQDIFEKVPKNQLLLVANTGGLNPSTGLWTGTDTTVVVAQRLK